MRFKALTIGSPNPNGHIYDKEMVAKEVERLRPTVEKRSLVGEFLVVPPMRVTESAEEITVEGLPHPYAIWGEDADGSVIHAARVSHVITALILEDDGLYVEFDVLNSPAGLELQEHLASDNIIPNARGIGWLNGPLVYEYHLITVDMLRKDEVVV